MLKQIAMLAAVTGTACGLGAHSAARAQSSPATDAAPESDVASGAQMARMTLFIENDGPIRPNNSTDRYYTSGVKIDFSWQPDWARGFADVLALGGMFDRERTAFGVAAAQKIFTPWKYGREDPHADDHPYAGYLYGSAYFQRATKVDGFGHSLFDHVQVDMGVVGPSSLGEESQKEIHRITDDPIPQGWSHQLSDEFAINLMVRRKARLRLSEAESSVTWELIPEAGFDVGTVLRQAVGGVMIRFGQNLPDDYGAARLDLSGSAVAPAKVGFGWEAYARAQVRLVQHDIFLDGNTWQDSASVDKEPFVSEFQLGGALHFGPHVSLGYSQFFVSEQFENQDGWHGWGAVFLRAAWTF